MKQSFQVPLLSEVVCPRAGEGDRIMVGSAGSGRHVPLGQAAAPLFEDGFLPDVPESGDFFSGDFFSAGFDSELLSLLVGSLLVDSLDFDDSERTLDLDLELSELSFL